MLFLVPDSGAFDSQDFNQEQSDWDYGYYKGRCQNGYAQNGLSKDTDPGNPHAILCQRPDPSISDPYFTSYWDYTLTIPYDERIAYRGADWDPGFWKMERDVYEYVSGTSQNPSTHALHGIKCSSGIHPFGPTGCYTRPFDSSGAAGDGDWDPWYYKAECAANEVMVGVSADPRNSSPHAVLCCPQ